MELKKISRDVKDIRLIWHYLAFDKQFISMRSDIQLKDLKKQVISLIKTIERDTKFNPAESNLCDWCEVIEYCPAKKHEIKVQELSPNKYLKEKGVSLVNKYASIKAQVKELKKQEEGLQLELNLIEESAIEYARKEDITTIVGSDHSLRITEEETLQFPLVNEEGREELERYIKKAGIWDEVSGLNLARLSKMLENEELDNKMKNGLLKFAEEVEKIKVSLVKKGIKEED